MIVGMSVIKYNIIICSYKYVRHAFHEIFQYILIYLFICIYRGIGEIKFIEFIYVIIKKKKREIFNLYL